MYPVKPIPILDSKVSSISFLMNIITTFKSDISKLISMSLIITFFSIVSSFYFKCLIDRFSIIGNNNYLNIIFIVFLFCYLIKILTNYFRNQVLILVNQKIDLVLTTSTFKKIILFPYHYYRNRTTGEIVSRMNDINVIWETISKIIVTVFIDLLLALISLIILFVINSSLAMISTLIFLLNIILLIGFQKIFNLQIEDCKIAKDVTNSYMIESVSGFETVKGLSLESKIIKKFNNKYLVLTEKIRKFNGSYNVQQLLKDLTNEIGNVIMLFIGVNLVINNQLTLGSLITFSSLLNYFLERFKVLLILLMTLKK